MLQLFADGQQLDTSGVKFNLMLKNPMFMHNKLEGSYIFNFNLPATDRNRKILDFPNRLEKFPQEWKDYKCRILFNGITIVDNSTISVKQTKEITFITNVKVESGNFNYLSRKLYLNEIDYGSDEFGTPEAAIAQFNFDVNKSWPDVNYSLPKINGLADTFLPEGTTGYHHKDTLNYYDITLPSYLYDVDGDKGVLVPFLYLVFVLKNLFKYFGYKLDDQFFSNDNDWKKLMVFNTYNANYGIPSQDDDFGYYCTLQKINYNNHLPHIKILDFLKGLQNLLNISFHQNSNSRSIRVFDNLKSLQSHDYINLTNVIARSKKTTLINNDGFNLVSKSDGDDEYFQSKIEIENKIVKLFGGTLDYVADLPTNASKYIVYFVNETSSFYLWDYYASSWNVNNIFDTKIVSQIFSGNKEISISTIVSTLLNNPPYGLNHISIGNSAINWKDNTPRLVFYNGATLCHNTINSKSLLINGDKGIYQNRWRSWIEWEKTARIVELKKLYSPIEILNLDFSKKHRDNGINYLIDKIKIPITENAILPATMTCYKV